MRVTYSVLGARAAMLVFVVLGTCGSEAFAQLIRALLVAMLLKRLAARRLCRGDKYSFLQRPRNFTGMAQKKNNLMQQS